MLDQNFKRLEFVKALAQEQGLGLPLGFTFSAAICELASEAMRYSDYVRVFKAKGKAKNLSEYQEQKEFYQKTLLLILHNQLNSYWQRLEKDPKPYPQKQVFKVAALANQKRAFLVEASSKLDFETQVQNLGLVDPVVLGTWDLKRIA